MRISRSLCRLTGPIVLLLVLSGGSVATAGQAPVVRSESEAPETVKPATRVFGVTALSDGRTGYHVDANGPLTPEPFYLLRSRRLVVDLPGVSLRRPAKLPPASAPVRSLRLAQFAPAPRPVARLVIGVDRSIEYRLIPDATGATIEFGNPKLLEPVPAGESASPATPAGEPTASPAPTPTPTASRAHFIGLVEQKVRADF